MIYDVVDFIVSIVVEVSLMFHLGNIGKEVDHAHGHHQYGSHLPDGIAGKAHDEREHRAAEESHNHQSGHGILAFGHGKQCLGIDEGEDIGVAVAHKGNGRVENVPKNRPHMESAIIRMLMMKNTLLFITRRKKEPVRQPMVRKMK